MTAERMAIREGVPLAGFTTLRIGGAARYFTEPSTLSGGRACREWADGRGLRILLLGGGSNLLIDDGVIDALVIRPRPARGDEAEAMGRIQCDADDVAVVAAGGAAWLARLLEWTARRGWSGLEAWAAIPGTVGGAVAVNAGGVSGGLATLAEAVEILDADGTVKKITRTEGEKNGTWRPGYRDGGLGGAWVTRAFFRLRRDDPAAIRERMAGAARAKAAVQPLGARSAGCVFRNPPEGMSAGRLLDAAGLKGERVGGAMVSERHANFIVNTGDATAGDVRALMERMRERVASKFGVGLRAEIREWR